MKRISLFLLCLITSNLNAKTLPFEHWKTPNGVKVYFIQAMQVPMVDIKLAFKAGSAFDGKSFGLAQLTNELLNQKAGGESATELAEKLEDKGAVYESTITRDMGTLSLRTLSAKNKLYPSLKVFQTILNQPEFDKPSIARTKAQIQNAISHEDEVPQSLANKIFYASLYGTHPYAHSPYGTINTIQAITQDDIKRFYKTHYVTNDAVIAIVGALSKNEAKKIAIALTKNLPSTKDPLTIPIATAKHYKKQAISSPTNQTIIRLGQLGIRYDNQHRMPLIVGNYTLGGGGLVSRLADEIREKRGLSYGISSYFLPLEARGPFLISLATQNKQAREALSVTRQTLQSFVKTGPTDKELKSAKKYLNGSFPLRFLSNKAVLNNILLMGFYQLPNDYFDTYLDKVNKVTQKDIKDAFQAELQPNNLLTIVVGSS